MRSDSTTPHSAAAESSSKTGAEGVTLTLAAVKVLGLLERLERQAKALDDLRQSRSPLNTPEHHARIVGAGAKKLEAESARIHDTINSVVTAGFRDLGEEIDARYGLVQSEYANELRATFRGMSDKQRAAALKQASRTATAL